MVPQIHSNCMAPHILLLTPYTLVPQRPLHCARPRNSKKYALQSFCIVAFAGLLLGIFASLRIRFMPANIVRVTSCCSVCSVLQCVAAGRSGLYLLAHQLHGRQHVVHAIVLQRVAACCSVLQRVAVCCNVLQFLAVPCRALQRVSPPHASAVYPPTLCACHLVAACCSVLQDVAVCCSGSYLLAHQTHTRRHFVHTLLKHTPY